MNGKPLEVFTFLIVFVLISTSLSAQGLGDMKRKYLPTGLGLSNQLEYSYDVNEKREIFENWFNADYRSGGFSAGIRLDVFQPNDPNPAVSRGKEKYAGISFKYLRYSLGNLRERLDVTVGNYYELFGRGLILKSYEDRNVRIDNNLLGVRVIGKYANFILKALTGTAENAKAERKDILHAADLEYRGIKKLKLGASVASNLPEIEGLARTVLASARIQPSVWHFDFYAEYGIKQNEDVKNSLNDGSSIVGNAFYGSVNFYQGSFALSGEYKYYDNYLFSSYDGTVIYNNPPSVRKEYSYVLLNRHPSPLDQNNEQGFLVEAAYNFDYNTFISAAYGETKTLNADSYYQHVIGSNNPVRTQLKELYVQAKHDWSESFETIFAFGYNEELATNTKNISPIIETHFYFDDVNTIKATFEHLHSTNRTTDEQKYNDVLLVEYLRSPNLSVSWLIEMETSEPTTDHIVRKLYSFVQFGYYLAEHTNLSLLIGTRQAGNICIGGVCRYEPEFRGVELKMTTRLY